MLKRFGIHFAYYFAKMDMHVQIYWVQGALKQIIIYNNIKIASNVTFINHDIANAMLNVKNQTETFKYYLEPIEIFDNVVIGSNCIVGGGTVVFKDVPSGTIVAGNPGLVIGKFSDFEEKSISNLIIMRLFRNNVGWRDVMASDTKR